MDKNKKKQPSDGLLMKALLLSGKMVIVSRLVINSSTKNLSDNIKELEKCVDEYDEIIFKYHDETFNTT